MGKGIPTPVPEVMYHGTFRSDRPRSGPAVDGRRLASLNHELQGPFLESHTASIRYVFFTIPDAAEYFADAGSFVGLVATGADDSGDIESFLMEDDHTEPSLSLYDMSHRFIILPDDRSWLWMGDRDADLAIFGFTTEALQTQFVSGAGFKMFGSVDEAASHAMSFMKYPLDKSCLCGR